MLYGLKWQLQVLFVHVHKHIVRSVDQHMSSPLLQCHAPLTGNENGFARLLPRTSVKVDNMTHSHQQRHHLELGINCQRHFHGIYC